MLPDTLQQITKTISAALLKSVTCTIKKDYNYHRKRCSNKWSNLKKIHVMQALDVMEVILICFESTTKFIEKLEHTNRFNLSI